MPAPSWRRRSRRARSSTACSPSSAPTAASGTSRPRTLDLDIVLYGDSPHHEEGLTLPHPRAHERAFVLAPLLEVWPDAIIPGRGAASQYRERVADQAIERLPDNA